MTNVDTRVRTGMHLLLAWATDPTVFSDRERGRIERIISRRSVWLSFFIDYGGDMNKLMSKLLSTMDGALLCSEIYIDVSRW